MRDNRLFLFEMLQKTNFDLYLSTNKPPLLINNDVHGG